MTDAEDDGGPGFRRGGRDPEVAKQRRIAKGQREADEAIQRTEAFKHKSATRLLRGGILLCAVGAWFLVLFPSEARSEFVNLHRMFLGQTFMLVFGQARFFNRDPAE